MAPRDAERAKAKAEADREPLNMNGYHINPSPTSVRTRVEGTTVEREFDTVQTRSGMVGQAGTISRVRDRLAAAEEKKVPVAPPVPDLPVDEAYAQVVHEQMFGPGMGSNAKCR